MRRSGEDTRAPAGSIRAGRAGEGVPAAALPGRRRERTRKRPAGVPGEARERREANRNS